MKTMRLALLLPFIAACATTAPDLEGRFAFADTVNRETRASIEDYRARRVLPNGRVYGESVRDFRLAGRSPSEIRAALAQAPCTLKEDVIREPKKNQPILSAGKTTPIWIWSCADGGVIRIKPEGDPTNKFHPNPHGSKALRYPADTKETDFAHETAKIDEDGHALPKWPADMKAKDPSVLDEWGNLTHSELGR